MGLGNSNKENYLSIGDGKITQRVQSKTATSKERALKDSGKIVHEEYYDHLEGLLVGISTREHEQYGKSWVLKIQDGAETFNLQMKYSSGYASAFLKAIPNADLNSPIKIVPKMTIEGEKKKTSLFILQHGEALKWAYTKDHPNGLPQMVQVKVKGQLQWDDTDMMEFLENMVNTKIIPNLPKYVTVPSVANTDAYQEDHDEFEPAAAGAPVADAKLPF